MTTANIYKRAGGMMRLVFVGVMGVPVRGGEYKKCNHENYGYKECPMDCDKSMTIEERARKICPEIVKHLAGSFDTSVVVNIIAAELRAVREEAELRGGYSLKDIQKSYQRGLLRAAEICEALAIGKDETLEDLESSRHGNYFAERIRKEAGGL